MDTFDRLPFGCRFELGFEDDHRRGRLEVDADAAGRDLASHHSRTMLAAECVNPQAHLAGRAIERLAERAFGNEEDLIAFAALESMLH